RYLRVVYAQHHLLDLLELVDAVEAARVLARRARFAPEAGRDADVTARQLALGEDRIAVQRHQADLRRADEIELVLFDREGVLASERKEAGADHRRLPHHHRRRYRGEALLHHLVEREAQDRQLEQHAVAGERVAAAAGEFTRALEIDQAE